MGDVWLLGIQTEMGKKPTLNYHSTQKPTRKVSNGYEKVKETLNNFFYKNRR